MVRLTDKNVWDTHDGDNWGITYTESGKTGNDLEDIISFPGDDGTITDKMIDFLKKKVSAEEMSAIWGKKGIANKSLKMAGKKFLMMVKKKGWKV